TCPAQPFSLAAMCRAAERLVAAYDLEPAPGFDAITPLAGQIGRGGPPRLHREDSSRPPRGVGPDPPRAPPARADGRAGAPRPRSAATSTGTGTAPSGPSTCPTTGWSRLIRRWWRRHRAATQRHRRPYRGPAPAPGPQARRPTTRRR